MNRFLPGIGVMLVALWPLAAAAAATEIACPGYTLSFDDDDYAARYVSTDQDHEEDWSIERRRPIPGGLVVLLDGGVGGYKIAMTIMGEKVTIEHSNWGSIFRTDLCALQGGETGAGAAPPA